MGKMVAFPGNKAGFGVDTPGGGDNFGGMEARVAKLEAYAESSDRRLTLIEQDLRDLVKKQDRNFMFLVGAIATSFILTTGTLLGVMAKGFGWLK